jgi:hypothetical protein
MAAIKTSNTSNAKPGVQYHVLDAHGNHLMLETAPPSVTPAGVAQMKLGSASNFILISQQNAADLAAAITNFGSTGTLT